jgi:hypothetical protein
MINNNIQEAYCSFEVSKLLKEKGCDLPAQLIHYYPPRKKDNVHLGPGWGRKYNYYVNQPKDGSERIHSFTHALAIEWIRVNFGIWITVGYLGDGYNCTIQNKEGYTKKAMGNFNSPTEAYEAAIKYTLQNLIP